MIIENKGEFNVSELLEHKQNIKSIEFKNISEIKNLELLTEFKLLSELKLSTCFIENNKVDLSQTSINTLAISNCYFNINDIIMPISLKHLIVKSTTISIINCKGLSDIDAFLQMDIPVKIYLRNTDTKASINSINDYVDIELESTKKIIIKNKVLKLTF